MGGGMEEWGVGVGWGHFGLSTSWQWMHEFIGAIKGHEEDQEQFGVFSPFHIN